MSQPNRVTTGVSMIRRFTATVFLAFVSRGDVSPVRDYDMDCKVILCLAAGFPTGCTCARACMLQRLWSLAVKPPFRVCDLADPADYRNRRGRENLFPCAAGFPPSKPIAITTPDATAGAPRTPILACRQGSWPRTASAEGGSIPAAVVLPPSRGADHNWCRIFYECRRRPMPHWLQLGKREHFGRWLVSENYWWR